MEMKVAVTYVLHCTAVSQIHSDTLTEHQST